MDQDQIDALNDKRLIEHGFPCHQVGAETGRERDTGKQPPTARLHIWWARRPLTPSRAAIVASFAAWDADPDLFVRQLGIERIQALVNGEPWTLTGDLPCRVERDAGGAESLAVDDKVLNSLRDEQARRGENRAQIARIRTTDPSLAKDPVLLRWAEESRPLPAPLPMVGAWLPVRRTMGDPAHIKDRIAFAKSPAVKKALGKEIKWDAENLYGYGRAFATPIQPSPSGLTVLDPTAGGGSIPFEALRLGHNVIANELNPVATTILYATLDYPARFGPELVTDIRHWGRKLLDHVEAGMEGLAPFSTIPESERARLREHLKRCPELLPPFDVPEYDHTGLIYVRQVNCPHCGGEAPLLNTLWLSKEASDPWGVRVVTDGRPAGGKVRFETYRITGGHEPTWGSPER